MPRRLADEGLRRPGGEVVGIGGVDGIDRERHQYRSAAWQDSGPVNVE
jgi:hypothetical protein